MLLCSFPASGILAKKKGAEASSGAHQEAQDTCWVWGWEGNPERYVCKPRNGHENARDIPLPLSEGRGSLLSSPSEGAEKTSVGLLCPFLGMPREGNSPSPSRSLTHKCSEPRSASVSLFPTCGSISLVSLGPVQCSRKQASPLLSTVAH